MRLAFFSSRNWQRRKYWSVQKLVYPVMNIFLYYTIIALIIRNVHDSMYSFDREILRKQILMNVIHDIDDSINILWFGEITWWKSLLLFIWILLIAPRRLSSCCGRILEFHFSVTWKALLYYGKTLKYRISMQHFAVTEKIIPVSFPVYVHAKQVPRVNAVTLVLLMEFVRSHSL